MDLRRLVIVGSTALTVACGSTPAATTPPVSTAASAVPSVDCAAFTAAVDHTVTQFAYLKVAVGSDLDETERLTRLQDYTSTMAADAAACAPAAASSLMALRDETNDLAKAYQPNADGAVAEGIFGILVSIRATGEKAWGQMGRPTEGWKELPIHEDGTTM